MMNERQMAAAPGRREAPLTKAPPSCVRPGHAVGSHPLDTEEERLCPSIFVKCSLIFLPFCSREPLLGLAWCALRNTAL